MEKNCDRHPFLTHSIRLCTSFYRPNFNNIKDNLNAFRPLKVSEFIIQIKFQGVFLTISVFHYPSENVTKS